MLTHKVPFLWRFHLVHHADLDLDASTALRFHFGEMALSVPYRAAQVLAVGASPRALSTWQSFLLVSILFHHSNLRLPVAWERRLVRLVVTPRMHGIHHSIVREETDSNWSSGLTIWDRLHGTLNLGVVTLPRILAMPFVPQPPSFRLPNGARPTRALPLGPAFPTDRTGPERDGGPVRSR